MFTGIVEEIGHVAALDRDDRSARLHVRCATVVSDVQLGDSIAVDGCCLTVTSLPGDGFTADLMAETLRATSLGDLAVGAPVNLERAMRADARLGGHLVQGHVDAVGELVARDEQPGTVFVTVRAPAEVARYLVAKGSVTVAGTSLTVVEVTPADDGTATFRVGLIPHTLEVTTWGDRVVGDPVNLEADVIAKHVEHLLALGTPSPYTTLEDPR
ncbi:riboflavin synthase [Nitriliruptoraceae bacterium ZYF776]|nr:riboflavin synthase [Profundirhabdus halotolerans]